jgi:hypothetical protein
MNDPWRAEAPGVFSFQCDGFSGQFFCTPKSAPTLTGQLQRPFEASLFTLGPIDFAEEAGRQESIAPRCKPGYIQNPYLVAPQLVDSAPGLHLTAFIRASDEGLDADFRLTTVSELKRAALECNCAWPSGICEPRPDLLAGLDHPKTSQGIALARLQLSDSDAVWMYWDVGEHGMWRVREEAGGVQRLQCNLFEQPLEKGVILVGRFALRRLSNESAVRENLLRWLDRPTASL